MTLTPARTILDDGEDAELAGLVADADVIILAVSDHAIASVAAALPPSDAVYAHLSGATDLAVLHPHRRTASMHPLMSLPDAATGARPTA